MKKLPLDFGDTQGFHIVDCIGIPIVSQLYPVILGISPKRSTMRKSHRKSHYFNNPKYIIYDSQYIPIIFLYLLLLLLLLLLYYYYCYYYSCCCCCYIIIIVIIIINYMFLFVVLIIKYMLSLLLLLLYVIIILWLLLLLFYIIHIYITNYIAKQMDGAMVLNKSPQRLYSYATNINRVFPMISPSSHRSAGSSAGAGGAGHRASAP